MKIGDKVKLVKVKGSYCELVKRLQTDAEIIEVSKVDFRIKFADGWRVYVFDGEIELVK